MKKSLELAKKLGIEVIITTDINARGRCINHEKIEVIPNADDYTVLHEMGHILTEFGCCREHDEYIAHGVAIGLAKAFDIEIPDKTLDEIRMYAGSSSHRDCDAIN